MSSTNEGTTVLFRKKEGDTFTSQGLKQGQRLRITWKTEQQKLFRLTVAVYLDFVDNRLVLSQRPVAGTTEIPIDDVYLVESTSPNAEIVVGRVLREEV
jgi:hypothetical protein